jgi:hypothetical protein
MSYAAPLADMRFVLEEVAGLAEIAQLPGYEAASPDLVEAILGEAGRLAQTVLAPLNQPADRAGSVLENGVGPSSPNTRLRPSVIEVGLSTGWLLANSSRKCQIPC